MDIITAMLVILVFVGIMTAVLYNAYLSSIEAKRTAAALNYAVDIFERIGELEFNDVIASYELLNIEALEDFQYEEIGKTEDGIEKIRGEINNYNVEIAIEDYNNEGLIKKINLTIKYNVSRKNEEKIELQRLKVIETDA